MKPIRNRVDLDSLLDEHGWPNRLVLPREVFDKVVKLLPLYADLISSTIYYKGVAISAPARANKLVDLSQEEVDGEPVPARRPHEHKTLDSPSIRMEKL